MVLGVSTLQFDNNILKMHRVIGFLCLTSQNESITRQNCSSMCALLVATLCTNFIRIC